jgi:ribosomal protein L28
VSEYNRTTGELARYKLLKSKNTGALPPMIQRTKHIFHPNLRKVVWQEKPMEVMQ